MPAHSLTPMITSYTHEIIKKLNWYNGSQNLWTTVYIIFINTDTGKIYFQNIKLNKKLIDNLPFYYLVNLVNGGWTFKLQESCKWKNFDFQCSVFDIFDLKNLHHKWNQPNWSIVELIFIIKVMDVFSYPLWVRKINVSKGESSSSLNK